jgi:hypothetical protein
MAFDLASRTVPDTRRKGVSNPDDCCWAHLIEQLIEAMAEPKRPQDTQRVRA